MPRVPASKRTRESIEEMLKEGIGEEGFRTDLVRSAVQLIVEEAMEATVRDLLGREYYERTPGGSRGYRNGHRSGRLKTSEGDVRFSVPQVREIDSAPLRTLRDGLQGRTEALEDLAVEMYARGCSTRDIEDAFRDDHGRSLLPRTVVSEVTEALWKEYEEFATRDLSEVRPLYLFLDGIAERLHSGVKRDAVLCAWVITWEGKKVLVALAPGTKESTECVTDFLQDLKRRGLSDPILYATDGAAGLIAGAEKCFPSSMRQRCLAHKMRNILSKVSEEARAAVRAAAKAAYEAPSVNMATSLRDHFLDEYRGRFPSAAKCFEEDFDACIAHLRCPSSHQRVIRTTNLLERLFEEERRRMRAVGHLFGEKQILKLMFSALIRASERWRGIRITDIELGHLRRLEKQLLEKQKEDNQPVVRRSARQNFSSKTGT